MAWLWSSWKEFTDAVHPVALNKIGVFNLSKHGSLFENQRRLHDAVRRLTAAVGSLNKMGFEGDKAKILSIKSTVTEAAKDEAIMLVYAGEELLLYHKRLALSQASYGFLHQNDLLEHWEHYSSSGRIGYEVAQLVEDAEELLAGYDALTEEDERFLVYNLDLPKEIEADFYLARNLFSVGFEDVGVLIAGRGLEGILRIICHQRKIMIDIKGKRIAASEADTFDLIETMYRIRWKTKGTRVITTETKALLHYLRTLRNDGAHASIHLRKSVISPRETAELITETAKSLWRDIVGSRSRFDTTVVTKSW
jgi:hypothetical protein